MNRILYAVCLAFLLPITATAQRSLSVSATVVPTFERTSYLRRVFYPNSDGQVVEPIYLNGIRWSAGFQAGVSVQYAYAPGWSVGVGVWYRQVTTRQARFGNDGRTTIHNRAIRLPVLLNFKSSSKRLSPYFSLGVLADIPMQLQVLVAPDNQPTQQLRLDSEPGPYVHILAGAGARYQAGKRYVVVAQPVLTYNLGRFGGMQTHNPSFELGLQTQVGYSF